jgi:hypothetical protein
MSEVPLWRGSLPSSDLYQGVALVGHLLRANLISKHLYLINRVRRKVPHRTTFISSIKVNVLLF